MSLPSRRNFLATAGSLALAGAGGRAFAAMGPTDKFDLVIKGGDVLDPSQSLRGGRDIGIRYGMIEAIEADIPAERALRVLDAAGKLVTPGLVDLHCHVYPYGSALGIPADEVIWRHVSSIVLNVGWSQNLERDPELLQDRLPLWTRRGENQRHVAGAASASAPHPRGAGGTPASAYPSAAGRSSAMRLSTYATSSAER